MDNNTKGSKQIDNRGPNDLERVIEEQSNHIIILERHLEDAKEKINMLDKQVKYLQQSIRNEKNISKRTTQ